MVTGAVSGSGLPLQPDRTATSPYGYASDGPIQGRKLFIGGLSHDTDDDQLRAFYEKWGTVIDCIVIRDPGSKQSRGFGFVTYSKTEMAARSLSGLPHIINGKQVDPKPAVPREDMTDEPLPASYYQFRAGPHDHLKLFIKGLCIERSLQPDYYLVDVLRAHFGQFGQVEQVEISVNPRRLPYVIMHNAQAVAACLKHNNHHIAQRKCYPIRATHFVDDLQAIFGEQQQGANGPLQVSVSPNNDETSGGKPTDSSVLSPDSQICDTTTTPAAGNEPKDAAADKATTKNTTAAADSS